MDENHARQNAIRKETCISAVMNVVLGSVFFLAVFGWQHATTASLALDFLPQTMGMTFIGGMVTSLVCLSKVAKGTLMPAGPVPTPRAQAIRVLGCAIVATIVFGGMAALLLTTLGSVDLAPAPAFTIKALYGVAMGLITTPPIGRMALGMDFWPRAVRHSITGARS